MRNLYSPSNAPSICACMLCSVEILSFSRSMASTIVRAPVSCKRRAAIALARWIVCISTFACSPRPMTSTRLAASFPAVCIVRISPELPLNSPSILRSEISLLSSRSTVFPVFVRDTPFPSFVDRAPTIKASHVRSRTVCVAICTCITVLLIIKGQ